ncbi:hypothetical protein ACP70R_000265 [Stipagrostis hirtigluma subsp. patula]
MRAGLQDARRRHAWALLAAAERATSGRRRAADAKLERVLCRNTELEESHEAVAAGLRATLDQLLQQFVACAAAADAAEGDADDAQSCCFEAPAGGNRTTSLSSCNACECGEACVLLLPCRHLCLCCACESTLAEACPVCAEACSMSCDAEAWSHRGLPKMASCFSTRAPARFKTAAMERKGSHGGRELLRHGGRGEEGRAVAGSCCSVAAMERKGSRAAGSEALRDEGVDQVVIWGGATAGRGARTNG